MALSRVNYLKKEYTPTSYTYANSTYSITSPVANSLFTGVTIELVGLAEYKSSVSTANSTVFTVPCPYQLEPLIKFRTHGYLASDSGAQSTHSLPRSLGIPAIVQSYVYGTGGATFTAEVSLDGQHWIATANSSLSNSSGDTTFFTVAPGWAYMRANVDSIGANSNLVVIVGE